jgi:hypothetical protein
VPRAIGGLLWCARLHSDHKTLVNAQSPDELEEHYQQSELLWDMAALPRQHRGKTSISAVVGSSMACLA